jgi:hypothetical protein
MDLSTKFQQKRAKTSVFDPVNTKQRPMLLMPSWPLPSQVLCWFIAWKQQQQYIYIYRPINGNASRRPLRKRLIFLMQSSNPMLYVITNFHDVVIICIKFLHESTVSFNHCIIWGNKMKKWLNLKIIPV